MSGEEDDYMSDKYLPQSSDVRPSLLFTHSLKKEFVKDTKHQVANQKSRIKPKKVLEEENRNEGLKNALTAENKGFAMLQKMGYKVGMGIGKQGTGRTEPIDVNVKGDRGGLGRDTEVKRKLEETTRQLEDRRWKMVKLMEQKQSTYRSEMSSKMAEKRLFGDLRKSQKVCEQFDNEVGVLEPLHKWFWLKIEEEKDEEDSDEESNSEDDDDDESEELEPSFMLETVTEYLRTKYKYCIWCGIKFEDEDDMRTNCPGNTADDH